MKVSPKLAVITLLTSFIFFGLAIVGCGGPAAYFSHPARAVLAVAGLAMFVVALFSPGNISSGEREDKGNRWVLLAFSIITIPFCFLPAYTERIGFLVIDGDVLRWLGVALFTAGGVLRIYPVFVLGRRFSGLVAIQPGHTLLTDGIYSVIRHPSYLGLLMNALGWALSFRSFVGVLLALSLLIPLIARIRSEEALLRSQFGDEYEAYRSRTRWRLFPGIY